nr:MAG TPA: hypothetical protein [Caudoviricetes sp.]
MQATLSVLGLYNWDSSIFDGFSLPDTVDAETLRNLIFSETAELEVLYSDPSIFNLILRSWSKSRVEDWKRVESALNAEYSPIENYNRTETHSDVYTRNLTEKGSVNSNETHSENGKKAAFNDTALVDTDSTSGNSNTTDNNSNEYTGGDNRNINIRAHGNIGVTTNQHMIEAEIAMRHNHNLYNIIIDDFINKFCLGVY